MMIDMPSLAQARPHLRQIILTSAIALGLAAATPIQAATRLTMATSHNVGPLNPHQYAPNQMYGQAMVYEPLVKYTENGKVIPWLAESWKTSADGKTFTFILRKGVKFTDGVPFDAQAVKKNIDTVMRNRAHHNWLDLVNQLDKVEVLDTHTVKFVLKNSYYPFLQDLSLIRPFRFLSPASFPASGNTADGIKTPAGTGPWQVVEMRKGEYDHFKRNPNYWGNKPVYDEIMLKVLPDANTRALALESGHVDLVYGTGPLSPDTVAHLQSQPNRFTVSLSRPMATRMLAMNSKRFPTNDLSVRKAIEHAVNKDAIVKNVLYNSEKKADTFYATNVPYANIGLKPYAYDPAAAARLLDAAGWKLASGQKVRQKDGKLLEVNLYFVGNEGKDKAIAEVVQSDLSKIGIKVNLAGEEESAIEARQLDGSFHLVFNSTWGPPYEPHAFTSSMRTPTHADFQAQAGLAMKAEIDKKITEVQLSTNETKRAEIYRWILTTLHEQAVYLPISYTAITSIYNNKKVGKVPFAALEKEVPFELMQPK